MLRPIHPSLRLRAVWFAVSMAASLSTSSCFFHKQQPRAFRPLPLAKAALPSPPPEFPPPPELSAELPAFELPPLESASLEIFPPAPVPVPRPVPNPPKSVATQPGIGTPAVIEPAPQLGQIFTRTQIQESSRQLDEYERSVQRALLTFATKKLSKDDLDTVGSVKNFIAQAEQRRDKDLAGAVSLAKRADSLAKDLLDRLH